MTFLAIWQKNISFFRVSNIHVDECIKASSWMFIKAVTAPQSVLTLRHWLELQINIFCQAVITSFLDTSLLALVTSSALNYSSVTWYWPEWQTGEREQTPKPQRWEGKMICWDCGWQASAWLAKGSRESQIRKAILSACNIFGAFHFSCHSTPQNQPNKNSPVPRNTTGWKQLSCKLQETPNPI